MAQPMAGQAQKMTRMAVQVPPGMAGGMPLQLQTPQGLMQVVIPQGLVAGQTFEMDVPSIPLGTAMPGAPGMMPGMATGIIPGMVPGMMAMPQPGVVEGVPMGVMPAGAATQAASGIVLLVNVATKLRCTSMALGTSSHQCGTATAAMTLRGSRSRWPVATASSSIVATKLRTLTASGTSWRRCATATAATISKFRREDAGGGAFFVVNVATNLPLHIDGLGDKLASVRYGDCRDDFAKFTFDKCGV